MLDLSFRDAYRGLIDVPQSGVATSIETLTVHVGVLSLSSVDLPSCLIAEHDYFQLLVTSSVKLQTLSVELTGTLQAYSPYSLNQLLSRIPAPALSSSSIQTSGVMTDASARSEVEPIELLTSLSQFPDLLKLMAP